SIPAARCGQSGPEKKSAPAHEPGRLLDGNSYRPTKLFLSGGPGSVYSSSASPPLWSATCTGLIPLQGSKNTKSVACGLWSVKGAAASPSNLIPKTPQCTSHEPGRLLDGNSYRPTKLFLSGGPGSVYSSSASPPLWSATCTGLIPLQGSKNTKSVACGLWSVKGAAASPSNLIPKTPQCTFHDSSLRARTAEP